MYSGNKRTNPKHTRQTIQLEIVTHVTVAKYKNNYLISRDKNRPTITEGRITFTSSLVINFWTFYRSKDFYAFVLTMYLASLWGDNLSIFEKLITSEDRKSTNLTR